MRTPTRDAAAGFADTADKLFTAHWERPARAATADLDALWSAAAAEGWFDSDGSLPAALAVVRATGRFACPLPALDAFIAAEALADRPDLLGEIAAGRIRLVVAHAATADGSSGSAVCPLVEAGAAVTHVLLTPALDGQAVLCPVNRATPVTGLAIPPWHRIDLGTPVAETVVTQATAERIRTLRRFGLATRALAAAEHAHDLALAHAKVRRQFGKAVGAFGPVRQRLVDCWLELTAASLLITQAAEHYRGSEWPLAAELAVAHAARTAPRVQLAAHQTLAALGYHNEHDAPWLFRRVHADLAQLADLEPLAADVAAALLERDAELPDPLVGPAAAAARTAFRRFLSALPPHPQAAAGAPDDPGIVAATAAEGWLSFGWPAEAGGRGAAADEQAAVQQEAFRHRLPITAALAAAVTIGGAVLRHGTPDQRSNLLPAIARGELRIAVGYSEPDAGSDLAALRTRADRDGDHWVITGRKAWTGDAHRATHLWLAARTDPDAEPPHDGITLFLLPADAPGVATRPDTALSGQVTCTVLLNAVRVPDSARVGPVNGGWRVLAGALESERVVFSGIAATSHRQLADLIAALASGPRAANEAVRARITELAARVQGARLVAAAATAPAGPGPTRRTAHLLAPAAKILGTEVGADLTAAAPALLGTAAAVAGPLESALRLAPGGLTAGGTNDVHRGLIARALGLPG